MAKMKSLSLIFFSHLFLVSSSAAVFPVLDDLRFAGSSFPSVQAKKLIRELNLFPKEEVNLVDQGRVSLPQDSKLVEKRFKFPGLEALGGVSVDDFGHHAGYYKLPNSYDARYFFYNCDIHLVGFFFSIFILMEDFFKNLIREPCS